MILCVVVGYVSAIFPPITIIHDSGENWGRGQLLLILIDGAQRALVRVLHKHGAMPLKHRIGSKPMLNISATDPDDLIKDLRPDASPSPFSVTTSPIQDSGKQYHPFECTLHLCTWRDAVPIPCGRSGGFG
jgi:hypothetical protein